LGLRRTKFYGRCRDQLALPAVGLIMI